MNKRIAASGLRSHIKTNGWWARISFALLLLAQLGIGLQTLVAQELEHGPSYEKRKQLAQKFLEPQRILVVNDNNFRTRFPDFLVHYAQLDPVWTADFMLEHPAPDDGVLYDYNAVQELMRQAEVLPTETVVRLIESTKYMRANVALLGIKNLSANKVDLRERIIDLVLDDATQAHLELVSFANGLELAGLSRDSQRLKLVQGQINEFFTSGKAKQLEDSLGDGNSSYYSALLERFAPAASKASNQPTETNWYHLELTILSNAALDIQQKRKRLRAVNRCVFGTQAYEVLGMASQLGQVALIDEVLAMQWAETAPDVISRTWAKLTIAPAVAKRDTAAAAELILSCYDELERANDKEADFIFYSAVPADVAYHALALVRIVAPENFSPCLDRTIKMASRFQAKPSTTNPFLIIAKIAAYAPDRAKLMFEEIAGDVRLGHASGFFKALLAIELELVWKEYELLPEKDRSGNEVRPQVLTAILPALLQRKQSEFWSTLCRSDSLTIAPEILEAPQVKSSNASEQ